MARLFVILVVIVGIAAFAWHAYRQGAAVGGMPFSSSTTAPPSSYAYLNASADDIFVSSPPPGKGTTEHLIVRGFAKGPWFSGGVFPVAVATVDGVSLGGGDARALADWTVRSFVPFVADFTIDTAYVGPVVVTLKNGGASAKSADASLSFPLVIQ